MSTEKRREISRSEIISARLKCLARRVPGNEDGHLVKLAEYIEVHQTTLSAWAAQGYIPMFQVRKMQKRFGSKQVPANELCPEEFRSV